MLQSQNVTFLDETKDWEVSVDTALDSTFKISDNSDVLLGDFLSRPIRLANTLNWTSSSFPTQIFYPWQLFFGSAKVKDKMRNFNLLRATLKLKFVVNGNSFQYGTLVAVYTPLRIDDQMPEPLPSSGESAAIIYTQRPHIFLSPTNSQGGVMSLPFIWPFNYLSVPDNDFTDMGTIRVFELNALRSAGAAAMDADVNIFAWAEDVELAIPTSQPVIATSQSGDEYGMSPVSGIANAVADAAMSISQAPAIGPYARASSYVARAIGAIASLMGFSRPAVITDIEPFKPMYFGNLANTNTGDTVEKLTIDCKQETTIDPRVAGMAPVDEMSIVSISSREAYFFQATWGNQSLRDTRICMMNVTPMAWRIGPEADADIPYPIYLSPCAFTALPFKYWRGTMKYRFQIVASAFHKGRIRVVWDPNVINDQVGSSHVFADYNVAYSTVVDIATCRDFTVEIGWGQIKTYLQTAYIPGYHSQTFVTGEDTTVFYSSSGCNGQLGVYIVNKLVTLDTTPTSIYINVYVSCPDLEVFGPDEAKINGYTLRNIKPVYVAPPPSAISQSGLELLTTSDFNAPLAQDGSHNITLGPLKPTGTDHSAEVYHGDPIVSIRSLFKRYCSYATYVITTTTAKLNQHHYYLSDFPTYQGSNLLGNCTIQKGSVVSQWTLSKTTFLNYFTPCYVIRRGGIRWKYAFLDPNRTSTTSLTVVRRSSGVTKEKVTRTPIDDSGSSKASMKCTDAMCEGTSGMAITCTDLNPVVQVEIPYYSDRRFKFARHADYESPPNADLHTVTFSVTDDTKFGASLDSYVAAADDYSLSFFLSTPVLWKINRLDILPRTGEMLFTVPSNAS